NPNPSWQEVSDVLTPAFIKANPATKDWWKGGKTTPEMKSAEIRSHVPRFMSYRTQYALLDSIVTEPTSQAGLQ
ncbi:MAG: hypothetical protein WC254_06235, partial [Candidatus Woesearchaeota archaeon]